ncbi:LacI family transcriptional regulator [Rhodococcus sp. HM1]|uniref:LacI family DNA-binding transcriptional regulator n=1 Tax=unclassified Rhodococcus (in: high G+C Gram-positive bacteria) TaxID=192944 RepID=UPI0018CE89C5|nr:MULTISPECIES: LacI family DNA-binding transcriptional regulator [unclassified Rhodococcus (in: high G+C Gram-positive bacteria)]MBH0118933.1 LacI family DNA-binding transcriptional regulator [Rhodococcus sp. CX]MCK8674155.1 LacI family transcriptional regulator [Rhodococcus sp. HM1]
MSRPDRAPTLKEIAERAGVHVSTASRVLRQPEPVDGWSESALRVREVAAELGYRPNLWAASLRTRKTTTLGVVMPRLTDGVVATTYQGIEEAATKAGYSVLLSSPPDDLEAQRRAITLLVGRQVDGLLLSSLHIPGRPFVESLGLGQLPILTVTRHADAGLPFVVGDDYRGGALAARHLLDRGYTDLAIIAGPDHASTARDRRDGFLDTLREASVEVSADRIVPSSFDVSGGVEAGRALLDRTDRPRAIFAVSDTIAIGILGVARDLGLSIPDDLAVVGYNDIPVVAQLPVPLTTVRSPAHDIGVAAVRRLLDLVRDGDAESMRLPVELVVRASS